MSEHHKASLRSQRILAPSFVIPAQAGIQGSKASLL